jgi:hypothetical protein
MAEKSGSKASDAMPPFGFDAMMQMQRPALASMAEMNGRLYENITAANREWATFVNRCLGAGSVPGLRAVLPEHTWAQYQSGLEQMTKLSRDIAEHALQSRSGVSGPTQH